MAAIIHELTLLNVCSTDQYDAKVESRPARVVEDPLVAIARTRRYR